MARGKNLYDGANILKDWLGDGLKPAPPEESQARADICTKQRGIDANGNPTIVPCPHNRKGFAPIKSAAEAIRAWSSRKNEMNLHVQGEENLHTCHICFCHLPTKVHVPMPTILNRMDTETLDEFTAKAPENCWMRQAK